MRLRLTALLFLLASVSTAASNEGINLSTGSERVNMSLDDSGIHFSPEFHNVVSTSLAEFTTTNGTLGPCVTGSTLAIVTAGGRVEIALVAATTTTVGSATMRVAFLQDGAFVPGQSAARGAASRIQDPMSLFASHSFTYLLPAPAPGQHEYCATVATSAGSITLTANSANNQFFVKEIR